MSEAPAAAAPAAAQAPATATSTTAPITAAPAGEGTTQPVSVNSWTDSFSPELKDYVSNKGFKDPKAVLDSYINLEKLRGVPQERLLKMPEDPADAGWNEVYQKLGKPLTPEEYGLRAEEGGDSSFVDWAKGTFHELNLTKSQAQSLVQKFGEFAKNRSASQEAGFVEKLKSQEMDLKKEWGAAYHQNVANAQAAARAFDIPGEAIDALEKVMGFDGVMKFMNNIGSKIGEAAFHSGGPSKGFGQDGDILTPSQARAKIDALKRDSDFTQKYLAGDPNAKERLTRLHKMAYPDD